MTRTLRLVLVGLLLPLAHPAAQDAAPLLLREPGLSATQICFSFADDIWLVPRQGGDAG
jgi:tricorn protease